jgi:hypothetical protein
VFLSSSIDWFLNGDFDVRAWLLIGDIVSSYWIISLYDLLPLSFIVNPSEFPIIFWISSSSENSKLLSLFCWEKIYDSP